ncbi:MAG: amino acid adenylation domain-containing protein [Lachnospiraceae bacterium]|nr:amino acid adenylation domain-containing protein [Lachnospiraceae bacterium]
METTILDFLDRAAALWGGRVVYADNKNTMTFAQLDGFSRSAGAYLQKRGVRPGQPVLVMGERGINTPACYMGVLRAGCFYAPVDASMPAGRLSSILEVIGAKYMIASGEFLEKVSALGFDGEIFAAEDVLSECGPEDYDPRSAAGLPETVPLYVIFTSGSTGKPKGVITSHHSLMCYIDAVQSVLGLGEDDILGNQAPLDYIAAVRDIYLPLFTGAKTVIIPKEEFAMPDRLFGILNESRVTTLCWSTAGLEIAAKLGSFDYEKPSYLRRVIFSGSVISNKYLRIWQENLPGVRFINQYGPTEATASCTYYELTGMVEEDTHIPIGRAYPHYSITLLDKEGRIITADDPGETGEICVGGPALALGYYGDEDRTKASFIQNPQNHCYRELIYRTGDLGRYREDGLLEFCGRMDRQIKHLGHRIELDEIEIAARQVGGVNDCCALYDDKNSLLYLFYEGPASSREIALYFRGSLPAFMVPRRIKQLDSLPRLANGKTDMRSLRESM